MDHVLIVTCGRTGSTLLQGIMNGIEGWHIKGENYNAIYHLYQFSRAIDAAIDNSTRSHNGLTTPFYGAANIDPEMKSINLSKIISSILLSGVDSNLTKVIGFKEIRYFDIFSQDMTGASLRSYLNFLNDVMHPLKIIFLTRNPKEVAQSDWWALEESSNLEARLTAFNNFCKTETKSNPERSFIIDYTDLLNRTPHLDSLFDFLGARPHPDRLAAILATPHSFNQKNILPSAVPINTVQIGSVVNPYAEADFLQINGRFTEASAAYKKSILSHADDTAMRLPAYIAGRAAVPAYQVLVSESSSFALIDLPSSYRENVVQSLGLRPNAAHSEIDQSRDNLVELVEMSLEKYRNVSKFAIVSDPISRFLAAYDDLVHRRFDFDYARVPQKFRYNNLNDFALNLQRHIDQNVTIASAFWPIYLRLGDDISQLDAVYPIEKPELWQKNIQTLTGRQIMAPKPLTVFAQLRLGMLSRPAFDALLGFYKRDYELLSQFYSSQRLLQKHARLRWLRWLAAH